MDMIQTWRRVGQQIEVTFSFQKSEENHQLNSSDPFTYQKIPFEIQTSSE